MILVCNIKYKDLKELPADKTISRFHCRIITKYAFAK